MNDMEKVFRQQQAAEEVRYRNMMTAQIRNAVIEIEDGDIDDAVHRLLTLIGEAPVRAEADGERKCRHGMNLPPDAMADDGGSRAGTVDY